MRRLNVSGVTLLNILHVICQYFPAKIQVRILNTHPNSVLRAWSLSFFMKFGLAWYGLDDFLPNERSSEDSKKSLRTPIWLVAIRQSTTRLTPVTGTGTGTRCRSTSSTAPPTPDILSPFSYSEHIHLYNSPLRTWWTGLWWRVCLVCVWFFQDRRAHLRCHGRGQVWKCI